MEEKSNGEDPRNRGEMEGMTDRNSDGTFAKGRNKTGGIKKGQKHKKFIDELEEMLDEMAEGKSYTYRQALKKQVLKRMIVDGDTSLLKEYWQQRDGRPRQNVGLDGGEEGKPIASEIKVLFKDFSETDCK